MSKKITKREFVEKIFSENSKTIQEYMKEKSLSSKDAYNELEQIIFSINHHLDIENDKWFKLKEVDKLLPVRLGYYKIMSRKVREIDTERYCEQCSLRLTEKGISVKDKYNSIRFS